MNRPFLELPEAAAKVIQTLRVYDDPPHGREILIEFSDGTSLSIDLHSAISIHAKHYREVNGALETLHEHTS